MKATATSDSTVFKPITLTLVLETEEEAKGVFNIFNYMEITNAAKLGNVSNIVTVLLDEIEKQTGSRDSVSSFSKFRDDLKARITR